MSECEHDQKKWDQVIQAVRKGDLEQFRKIIDEFQEMVRFAIAFHIRGNAELIDEIVHRSFIRAFKGLNTFRLGEPLDPWLRQIARNEARNELRKIKRETNLKKDLLKCAIAESRENHDAPVEKLNRLRQCMESLKEKARNLVEMHYFKKMSMKAIGDMVKKSPEAIRFAMLGIRRMLRTCIERGTIND